MGIYEIPSFYLKIEDELYCHVFSIISITLVFLGLIYLIKTWIIIRKNRKEMKAIKRRTDKLLLELLGEKDKNKKEKNI